MLIGEVRLKRATKDIEKTKMSETCYNKEFWPLYSLGEREFITQMVIIFSKIILVHTQCNSLQDHYI